MTLFYASILSSWPWSVYKAICQADNYGRMLITDRLDRMQLIDSDLNLLGFTFELLGEDQLSTIKEYFYNCERNEIIPITGGQNLKNRALIIFSLTEI